MQNTAKTAIENSLSCESYFSFSIIFSCLKDILRYWITKSDHLLHFQSCMKFWNWWLHLFADSSKNTYHPCEAMRHLLVCRRHVQCIDNYRQHVVQRYLLFNPFAVRIKARKTVLCISLVKTSSQQNKNSFVASLLNILFWTISHL